MIYSFLYLSLIQDFHREAEEEGEEIEEGAEEIEEGAASVVVQAVASVVDRAAVSEVEASVEGVSGVDGEEAEGDVGVSYFSQESSTVFFLIDLSKTDLYVYMNVSHRNINKWEISPFSGKIVRNQGSGDHREIA